MTGAQYLVFYPHSDLMQRQHDVPVELYGKGVAKSIQQLWKEVEEGETVLAVDDSGVLARELSIVTVRVKDAQDRVRTCFICDSC